MKKTLSIILVIVMLMALVPAAFAADGDVTITGPDTVTVGSTISLEAAVEGTQGGTVTWGITGSAATITPSENECAVSGITAGSSVTVTATCGEKSATKNINVIKKATQTTLTLSATEVSQGTDVTVTTAVTSGEVPVTDPAVSILLDGNPIVGTTISTSDLDKGSTHSVVAKYPGNATFAESTSETKTFTIKVDQFTVTFKDGSEVLSTQTVNAGEKATKPADPTKSGYVFKGWYTEATGSTVFNFDTLINADTIVYAQWKPVYTVSFNSNGGSAVNSQLVTAGNTVTRPADPTKSGYVFGGWFSDEALKNAYDFSTAVSDTSPKTLYAKWVTPSTVYTVTIGKYSGGNLGKAYYWDPAYGWREVTSTITIPCAAGTVMSFKMDPYNGYYRHPYVVNANGSYYSPGYGETFSVTINENKTVKLNFSQYVPTGDAGVWGYVVTMLASAGTAAGVYFGTKKKK